MSPTKTSSELHRFEWKSTPPTNTCRSIYALVILTAFMLALAHPALAQTESVLYSFGTNGMDGYGPHAGLAKDTSGNLYGTTYNGGTHGFGTVYKVTPTGTETVLYSFAGGADGANPYFAGVVLDKAGNIYGTTTGGGNSGAGTVFKLTPSGTESVIHTFSNNGTDGIFPYAGVVLDRAGNLYGTTTGGGASGAGTVFKITSTGTESVLHSFSSSGTDGIVPYAGVVLGKKKALYGTTTGGGTIGEGTVFKVVP